ncbi:MAG: hypothetical protein LUG16_03295 [Candidatus Gastranaerophilales bacterium]|nr:hypothetical protein [Candidatus Gastranaerophilales bacterium]
MKIITNEDAMNELLTPEEKAEVKAEVEAVVLKYKGRGGKRENSGRPRTTAKILKFTKRLTEDEAKFIDYAREHNINYYDLMEK